MLLLRFDGVARSKLELAFEGLLWLTSVLPRSQNHEQGRLLRISGAWSYGSGVDADVEKLTGPLLSQAGLTTTC